MVDALCQPVFTNSDSSVQVISKSDKQQAIASIRVKKKSSSMNKSIMEAMEKGNRMFVDSLNKICVSNLGTEKKCAKFQEAVNDKQLACITSNKITKQI
jgi:hypothetical protein